MQTEISENKFVRDELGIFRLILCHLFHPIAYIRHSLWDRVAQKEVNIYCCGRCQTQFQSFRKRFSFRAYMGIGELVHGTFKWNGEQEARCD